MCQNVNTTQYRSPRTGPQPQTERYRLTHGFEGTATLSETVIHAISGTANIDMSKLEDDLARQVEPTALNRLFRTEDQRATGPLGTLTLNVLGQAVTIYTDG